VTIKDLQKIIGQQVDNPEEIRNLLSKLKDKPFWIWDREEHVAEDIKTNGECCFNHIIGLPTKDGIEKPMFDYEKTLYDKLFSSLITILY
jgi:hypothetical protein